MTNLGEMYISVVARVGGAVGELRRLEAAVNRVAKSTASTREAGAHLMALGGIIAGAGGVVAYGLKRAVDAAAEINAAMTHLDTNLDSGTAGLREHAQALELARIASVQFNYAQKDIIDNLYRSISFTGDFNEALEVTRASLALAKGNRGDPAAVGEQFAIVANDFVDKSKPLAAQIQHLANLTSYTVRHGAFDDINQLSESLKISIGSAKAAGLSYEDLLATVQGFSKVGLVGSEAGSAIEESLQAFSKGKLQKELGASLATTKAGGLDIIGTFVNLRKAVGDGTISVEMFKRSSAALGIRGERALGINVNDLVAFRKQLGDPNLINGDAMRGAMTMMSAFNEQVGALGKRFDILLEHIGTPLIGPIQKFGAYLGAALDRVNAFADAHPQIVKFAVTFAAISAAIAIATGAAIALVGGFLLIAGTVGPLAGTIAVIGSIGVAIAGVVSAVAVWGTRMFAAGENLVKQIGAGIMSGAHWAIDAIGGVVAKVRAYLPFSPARRGALRDLHRVRIVEELSRGIQPSAAVRAMRRTTQAIALAGMIAMPGAAAAGAGGLNVTIPMTINVHGDVYDGDGFKKALAAHKADLISVLEKALQSRERMTF